MTQYTPPKPISIPLSEFQRHPEATIARCVEAIAAGGCVTLTRERSGFIHIPELGTLTGYRHDATGLEFYFEPSPLAAAFGERPQWTRFPIPTKEATP